MQRFTCSRFTASVFVLSAALFAFSHPVDADLVLVDEGVSQTPIVIYEDAPPRTRQAADELAEYIEKISGARPQLLEGEPDETPEHAIWVGYQPVLDTLFPNQNFDFEHPEEILVAANDTHLVIAGRDVWNPDHMVKRSRRGDLLQGIQQEYGTINAVYTFLQDHLEVRWLWPGEMGEDIVKKQTIAFKPFEHRYHPSIRARGGLLALSRLAAGGAGYGHSETWVRLQRLQLSSLEFDGGHGFNDWHERFHEDHPEYLALQPDGTRGTYPSPKNIKLCQSNPDVWDQWLRDVEKQLEEDPNTRVFSAAPNDGYSSGHCICENCRAWDHPDAEKRRLTWQGTSASYPALSDRHVTFANKLARKLKERYPDKDYYVQTLAYGHSRPAPIEAVPDDNVIVASVTGFWGFDGPERGSPNGTTHGEQITGWAKVTKNLVWRPNSGSPGGWQHGLPDVPLKQMDANFKYLAERDIIGIYVDSVWEHWGTQGPLFYLMAQLAWDPSKDGQAIMNDYYQRGFGPAADSVKAYWELMEQTRNTFVEETGSWNIRAHYEVLPEYYSAKRFDQLEAQLDKAAEQASDGPAIYAERVAFVRAGLDYTRLAVEGRAAITRYEKSGGTDTDAKELARQKWEQIDEIRQTHPLAVNWTPIGGKRDPLQSDFLPTISPRWRD